MCTQMLFSGQRPTIKQGEGGRNLGSAVAAMRQLGLPVAAGHAEADFTICFEFAGRCALSSDSDIAYGLGPGSWILTKRRRDADGWVHDRWMARSAACIG